MNKSEYRISAFSIAAAFIGTVIGAGFASGQEILQFFAVFGRYGILGLAIVTVLFILFGYVIMDLGRSIKSNSFSDIVRPIGGKYIGRVIDFSITFFLFGALTAMIAGSGALFNQQFGVSGLWGNVIMAVITVITVLAGIAGIINSLSIVVPVLLTAAISVSVMSIISPPGDTFIRTAVPSALVGNWLWASILYVSYNMMLAIAILSPLGQKARDRSALRKGALLGGLGLGAGAAAIYLALSLNLGELLNVELPMMFMAGRISSVVQAVYAVVLFAGIYTTAVGSLYGFATKADETGRFNVRYVVLGISVLALIASQFGFSNLVKYLYPIEGYLGIFLLVGLLYRRAKLRHQ